jgi:amino acid adenylation domain-containing protein
VDPAQLSSLTVEQQRELLAKLLRQQAAGAKRFPMSAGQQGLWHAFRRSPQLTAFNVFLPTRIRDPFQPEALRKAINYISQRHAALRTTFTDEGGQLVQVVHDRLDPTFSVHEMLGATDEAVRQRVMLETLVPFDLSKEPLIRISVYKLADNDWIILALTHHIIVDFWSLVLILSELRNAYPEFASGNTPNMPQPVDNYRQFVQDQAQLLASPAGTKLAEFWRQYLESVPPVLELPLDRPRPAAFTHRADCVPIRLSSDVSRKVSQLASQCRATAFAVLHSAMQVLLQRYSRQEDFFIGSPFAGRLHQKYEQTVGFFINMLPVKCSVQAEQTFSQLIQQTSMRLVDTLEHEAFPISEIVRRGAIGRDPSRSPLFQVSCTFERAQKKEELGRASFLFPDEKVVFEFGGMHQESFYIPHPTCHYDLEFVFEHGVNGIQALLIYCRDLFTVDSMQQMATNFSALVDCLLDNPTQQLGTLAWPSVADPARVQSDQSRESHRDPTLVRGANHDNWTVHGQILACAAANPEVIALKSPSVQLSYKRLVEIAQALSQQLLERGVQSQQLVPVLCRDGLIAFVGMLAAQLAGAAAVPVDLNQPSIELQQLMDQTQAVAVLSDNVADLSNSLDPRVLIPIDLEGESSSASHNISSSRSESGDLAYMIYTSGSTGVPKGVLIEHQGICNTLNWRRRVLPLDQQDRVLMLLSHQFDAALGIGWSCLTQGATIVWPDEQAKRDPKRLIDTLQSDSITVLPAVASLLRVLATTPQFGQCSKLHHVWTGGEAIPADLPELIRTQVSVSIWNLYGPTEASVEATAIEITHHRPNDLMTIGWPIDGAEVVVLDSNQQPIPDTVPGELAIGGDGLARGYFNDPALTERKFIVDPRDPSRRLYLTGDLGRRLADGRVEFLGRNDHQVKLRGYRIELGEIEATMQSYSEVERAAVIVDGPGTPSAQLIAFVSNAKSAPIDCEALRTYLTQHLAQYKIPAAIVQVDSMPLTSSGKVDRKRLPRQIPQQAWLSNIVQPRNDFERFLAEAWCAELKLPMIGIHQNFFEVGGSSLQAAMLTTQLSKMLQIHVPTALLFDLADIAQLAERLAVLHPQVLAARFGRECIGFYESAENSEETGAHPLLAPLRPTGEQTPIFMVHPPGGIVVCYRELARFLPSTQPLWAIRSRGLHGAEQLPESIEQMAADYIQALRSVQPQGPYIVGGWSLGGLVAFEMAKQLLADGQKVDRLVFLDTTIPEGAASCVPIEEQVNVGLEYGIELTLEQLGDLSPEEQLPLLHDHADRLGILAAQSAPEVVERVLSDLQSLFHHHVSLSRKYRLTPLDARLLLLRPQEVPFDLKVSEDRGWRHLFPSVDVRFVPGHHHSMVQAPQVIRLAEVMSQCLLS